MTRDGRPRSRVRHRFRGVTMLAVCVLFASMAVPALSQSSPTLTLTPDEGHVGDLVTAEGEGFSRDLDHEIEFGGEVVASLPANGPAWTGPDSFRTTFTVPDQAADPARAGTDVIVVQDGEPLARTIFTIIPTFSITPTAGPGGSSATVRGSGWDRTEPLTIDFPAGTTLTVLGADGPAWTSESFFEAVITVPALTARTYPVQAHQFQRKLLREVEFTVEATLQLDPDIGRVGSTADAIGTGFDRDFPLELRFDGEPVATLAADGPGWTSATTFTSPFEVPPRSAGPYDVEAVQTCGGACDIRASAPFTVTGLTLDAVPDEGPIASTTVVHGGGFDPDLPATVRFDGGTVASVSAADISTSGTFTVAVIVPTRIAGPYVIEACQRCGTANQLLATADFRVLPTLEVDPAEGPVDSAALAIGSAYDPALPLTVRFDGETVASIAPASAAIAADTTFEVDFSVPLRPGATYDVEACQRCGESDEILASAPFTVIADLVFEPPIVAPGFVTFAVGRGFPSGEAVVLDWDVGVGIRELTVRSDGTFRVPVLVYRRDRPGRRIGRAAMPVNEGLPEDQRFFEPEADLLVVPGSQQPTDFAIRR